MRLTSCMRSTAVTAEGLIQYTFNCPTVHREENPTSIPHFFCLSLFLSLSFRSPLWSSSVRQRVTCLMLRGSPSIATTASTPSRVELSVTAVSRIQLCRAGLSPWKHGREPVPKEHLIGGKMSSDERGKVAAVSEEACARL